MHRTAEAIHPSTAPTNRRTPVILLVAFVICMFAASIAAIGILTYHEGRQSWLSFHWREHPCAFWNSEILFAEQRVPLGVGPRGECRIFGINLKTLKVRDTGLKLPGSYVALSSPDRIWFVCVNEVVELTKESVVRHPTSTAIGADSIPFLLDDAPAMISPDANRQSRLFRFQNGDWQPGPRVAIPGPDRTWKYNAEFNRDCLVPRTSGVSSQRAATAKFVTQLYIGQAAGNVHLIYCSRDNLGNCYTAYRKGLDVVDDNSGVPSALAPENSEADTTGWYRLSDKYFHDVAFPMNSEPYIWAGISWPGYGILQLNDSEEPSVEPATIASELDPRRWQHFRFVPTPQPDKTFVVAVSRLQALQLFRLDDNRLEQVPFSLPGFADSLLVLEWRMVQWLTITWCAACLLLITGASWVARRWVSSDYAYGAVRVYLAPFILRFIARGIDLIVLLTPIILVGWHLGRLLINSLDREALIIFQLENGFRLFWTGSVGGFINPFGADPLQPIRTPTAFAMVQASMIWASFYFGICVICQGRNGFTPGKWICGLRVVRTTLRPCGLARSLLRELILWFETVDLIFPVPAVAAILLSTKGQRIGDRVADTIVVTTSPGDAAQGVEISR